MCVSLKVSLQVGNVLRFRQSGAGLIMFSLEMSADIFPWIRQYDVDKREVGAAGIGRWAPRTAHLRMYMRIKDNDVNIFQLTRSKGAAP